jgi:hypothetical protein
MTDGLGVSLWSCCYCLDLAMAFEVKMAVCAFDLEYFKKCINA